MRYRSDQECLADGGCLLPGRPGSPADLERLVDEIQMPHGPLERFVGPAVFPSDPFPAMVTPERDGHRLQRYLERTERTGVMHAPIPCSGEDFALFLKRIPGTFSLLGVRRPGSGIETSYPHYITFDPDERAIGYGVRAMAGWLAARAGTS